jgi:large subunit ribosomal protein L35
MPKMKTRKAAAKRFKKTKKGKIKHKKSKRNHLLTHQKSKYKRQRKQDGTLSEGDARRVKKMLPYE